MKNAFSNSLILLFVLSLTACTIAGDPLFQEKDVPVLKEVVQGELVDYASQIQPIFDAKCTLCHGASGGLDLSSYEGLIAGGANGDAVEICDGLASFVYEKVAEDTPSLGSKMPLTGAPLTETELELLARWIDEGANEVPTADSCTSLIDYATQVQPIFDAKCTVCHGASGGLDLSSYEGLIAGGANGDAVAVCDGLASFIYEKVAEDTPSLGSKMPLTGSDLTAGELDVLARWIDEGANLVPSEDSCTEGE